MALDTRLPLQVLNPGDLRKQSDQSNLMRAQTDRSEYQLERAKQTAPIEDQLNQLKVAQAQTQAVAQRLSGINDQSGWDQGLAWARSQGIPTENLPQKYDPMTKQRLMESTLSTAQQLDYQLKQQALGISNQDKAYDRFKDDRDYQLRKEEFDRKKNAGQIIFPDRPVPPISSDSMSLPTELDAIDENYNQQGASAMPVPTTVDSLPPISDGSISSMKLPVTENNVTSAQMNPDTSTDAGIVFAKDPKTGGFVTTGMERGYAVARDANGNLTAALIPGIKKPLSATEQKELYDATDIITSSEGAKGALVAARNLLDAPEDQRPYSGFGADALTTAARIPFSPVGDRQRGAATTDYNTLITEQALSSLKATFGGNPTEGERSILLQLQAISSYNPEEQKKILDRAISAAERRSKFNEEKAASIEGRDYKGLVNSAKNSGQSNSEKVTPAMIGGAKRAPDGNFYLPDPNRPGKYLKVN